MNILLRTADYRGDHAADVLKAYPYIEGETVEDLVKRVELKHPEEVVEIRIFPKSSKDPSDKELPF